MFPKIALSVVGLFALSALGFPAPASTTLNAATTFQAVAAQPGPFGNAVNPGLIQGNRANDKRFLLQGKKKGDPRARWCTVGYFKTRKEAEAAKAVAQRQNPGYDWQVVITTPGTGQLSNKK